MSTHQSTTVLERPEVPDPAPGRKAKGQRDRHRQAGIVLPAAAIASVLVAIVTVTSYLVSPDGSGAGNLSTALGTLPNSKSVSLLAHEEQQIRVMKAATSVMTVAAKPKVVSPTEIRAQQPQARTQTQTTTAGTSGTSSSSSAGTSSSSSTGTSGTADQGSGFEPSPAEAQVLAQELMPQFGFSVSSQWSCLQDLWQKESSWEWDAQNVSSGAYGIPQSLPAGKMASVASDYMTNASTQIKWGLGYIQSVYGTPCAADAHEIADHNY